MISLAYHAVLRTNQRSLLESKLFVVVFSICRHTLTCYSCVWKKSSLQYSNVIFLYKDDKIWILLWEKNTKKNLWKVRMSTWFFRLDYICKTVVFNLERNKLFQSANNHKKRNKLNKSKCQVVNCFIFSLLTHLYHLSHVAHSSHRTHLAHFFHPVSLWHLPYIFCLAHLLHIFP